MLTTDDYIKRVIQKAKANGIAISLRKGSKVNSGDGTRCGGYFDGTTLAVATNHSRSFWVSLFIHEACHMDQMLENSRFWNNATAECYDIFHRYLTTKIADKQDLEYALDQIVMIEADCERRALKVIDELKDKPCTPELYAKRANSYLHFHKAIYEYGAWYKIAPYRVSRILTAMDNSLDTPSKYRMAKKRDFDISIFEACI